MFDLINGIPIHPLVVHAVVVLLPLAILGTIAIVLRPAWRRPYGWLVVATALVANVLMPVATSSGEALEQRVGRPDSHAALGDTLIWFSLPLLLLLVALMVLDRRTTASSGSEASGERNDVPAHSERGRSTPLMIVSVLAVIVALAAGVQVYRVGDSGARAAWSERISGQHAGEGD